MFLLFIKQWLFPNYVHSSLCMLQTMLLSTINYLILAIFQQMSNIRFCKYYCKSLNIKIVLTPFKFTNMFKVKDPIPQFLESFVVYKFVCPGCNVCYIGETTRHLSTKIKEHLEKDKKSHIFAHLVNNETCKALSTENCFEIINSASTPFRLKLKEAMHIIWKKPLLNKQQKHVSIFITV